VVGTVDDARRFQEGWEGKTVIPTRTK